MKPDAPQIDQVDPQTLRLFYSFRDLQLALSAFDFFLEVNADATYSVAELRRFRCYVDAGVIAYGRPFTQAHGVPLLSFEHIKLRSTERQADLHAQLMRYRHKVVAHSDAEHMRIAVRSFSPFDDRPDIRLPLMRTDDSLPFLDDRPDIIDWLGLLMQKLAETTFALAQNATLTFEKHSPRRIE